MYDMPGKDLVVQGRPERGRLHGLVEVRFTDAHDRQWVRVEKSAVARAR
ncbi:hypothetical protein ACIF70_11325 [Actinacidiphila glaucinigra]